MFRIKLLGSLAFRVLFTSILFIAVPLTFYAIYIYERDYQEKLDDIFAEMHFYQKNQLHLIAQMEQNTLFFLTALHQLILFTEEESGRISINKIDKILNQFIDKSSLSAIFYLTVDKNSNLICLNSTLKGYENINFSPYFTLEKIKTLKDHIFIEKDPIFGYSLYFMLPIENSKGEIIGIAGSSIALTKLVKEINTANKLYKANSSIIDKDGRILVSTVKKRINKNFVFAQSFNKKPTDDVILIKEIESVNQGYEFYLDNQKQFLTFIHLPETSAHIIFTMPAKVLLTTLYKSLSELALLLLFILIIGGIVSYFLTLRFSKPLSQLSNVMKEVGSGNLTVHFEKDRLGFEINHLGEQFNQMVLSLINYIEEVKKERAFKEAYLKELQIGKEIQQSILPEGNIKFEGISSAIYFQPAKEVAGDFYDWIIKGDDLFITIADGVGKGISGCLYAFDLRSVLRTCETTFNDLGEIALKTNAIFCEDTKEEGSFVTAFLAKYNAHSRELTYANCGHNYPVLKRAKGHIERLEAPGIAFGVERFETIDVKKTTLEPDDFVIFYTDGLTDAQNTERKLFTEKRLIHIIESSAYSTPEELLKLINLEISLFTKGADQYDDMTLLILKF